ncbi:O-antigen polymerase [Pectobacterium polonicum]|uniref:O-antigen polymerase n=1 Tax=Pectobacterium polonicum TaxID=2485124 RepID=UPI00375512DA
MNKYIRILFLLIVYTSYMLLNLVYPDVVWFAFFSMLAFIISKPIFLLSPKTIIFAYYFLWFGLSPIFAERYKDINFDNDYVSLTYTMLATSYIVLLITCELFLNETKYLSHRKREVLPIKNIYIVFFSTLTLLFLFLYVQVTGGISYWASNLDRAFLTRQGAGTYYLGFTLFLPLTLFLFGINVKKVLPLILVSILVLILSPFIGSKQKIIIMFLILFVTKIYMNKLDVKNVVVFLTPVIFLFVLGNYFRNASWMEYSDILAYSLNYFDTLDSLFIVLRDYSGFDVMTFFLPFNKLYNLFTNSDEFFDLSAYLTSIYFPAAWDIRATVQFPIEADLYLSFGFWFGLPFLIILCICYIPVYKKCIAQESPIMIYIWFYLFIYLISHLRGGVFLWTDMYVYPYLLIIYFIFRKKLFYVQQN